MTKSRLKLINKIALLLLLILFTWTYFAKDNYRSVNIIHPDVLNEPVQTELLNKQPFIFNKDGYNFELIPVNDYELNALIVNEMNYKQWFNLSKFESIFPVDLCVIWGDNVKSKVYQSSDLSFRQDMRQARWMYSEGITFNNNQAANEHLIINNQGLEDKLKYLSTGDQVKIKGQLVNVNAKNTGETDIDNPGSLSMKTSTVRTDSGPGACEIIYVNDITILQKGHPLAFTLFKISYYSLIFLVVVNIGLFIFGFIRTSKT